MTTNTEPTVHGMGAYEGGQLPGALIRAALIRNARAVLAELTDREFADVVTESIRTRPDALAERIIDRVTK